MPEIAGQLVLAQNQHAFIQDATKGAVQVYAGPHVQALSANDVPVIYDAAKDEYVKADIKQAIRQNPFVPEGHYIVLTNPAFGKDSKLSQPGKGCNAPTDLEIGRKINILGPATFPLWPGQSAQAVPGHHLRSNQYLVVRVSPAPSTGARPAAARCWQPPHRSRATSLTGARSSPRLRCSP